MSAAPLVLFFFAGGAVLAVWLDTAAPRLGPRNYGESLLHLIGAVAAVQAMGQLVPFVVGDGTALRMFLALLVVVLPLAVYICLAKFWLLKLIATGAPGWR